MAIDSQRRRWLTGSAALAGLAMVPPLAQAAGARPILIGLDAEFRDRTSTSDDAIRLGIELAMADINRDGGLLGGRPLQLMALDNRSLPARGVENVRAFGATPELVAYLCGKFSPVALESLPAIHELGLPLLDPWAAADGIIDNGYQPNYAFRLGLRDSWAIQVLIEDLARRGIRDIGLLVPNSGWGRSNEAAARAFVESRPDLALRSIEWYNWGGETDLMDRYLPLLDKGAKGLVLVANEPEGAVLVRNIASLPESRQLPVVSHWGVAGGKFAELCGPALQAIDFKVVQTFSFARLRNAEARRLAERSAQAFGLTDPLEIPSALGIAHAYDLVRLLALAIAQAGSTDRGAIRSALETLPPHEGVVRRYAPAYTATRHEALEPHDLFLTRIDRRGRLLPVTSEG
ncbi:MAG: ABC transporter substrate-binding protein [Rhodocyclaceae bacterium]|nr:ABC transporter substrate-binding protein [Rhodocyclaceae bacterium]